MLLILFIILAITFVIGTLIEVIFSDFNIDDVHEAVIITIGVIAFITSVLLTIESLNPTAIDVYRGKTTLEVTYKDGVPIDTVVVFKEFKERK